MSIRTKKEEKVSVSLLYESKK